MTVSLSLKHENKHYTLEAMSSASLFYTLNLFQLVAGHGKTKSKSIIHLLLPFGTVR